MCLAIATPSVVVVLYVSGYSHPQCSGGTVCVKYTCYNVHESREQGKSEQ